MGIDPTLDVALLRPAGEGIAAAPLDLAPPAAIAIGQEVHVIGYPLGIGKSISAGIVSGVSRILPRTTSSWLSPYIQTDAAVSPGNSGGPLLDGCGRVVGLIAGKINAPSAENLAFAIPTEVLAPVVEELAAKGRVSRPWHGLYGQMVTPPILLMLGAPPWEAEGLTGFLVETIEPGSAADRAGLKGGVWPVMWGPTEILLGGDIITEVNGVPDRYARHGLPHRARAEDRGSGQAQGDPRRDRARGERRAGGTPPHRTGDGALPSSRDARVRDAAHRAWRDAPHGGAQLLR
jgi:putative serine protease PepD